MQTESLSFESKQLQNAIPTYSVKCDVSELRKYCQDIETNGGTLLSMWGADERSVKQGFGLYLAFFVKQKGLLILQTSISESSLSYPDISDIFLSACRMQRGVFDMFGIKPEKANDNRQWLRHHAWSEDYFPLREDNKLHDEFENKLDRYPFIQVEGEGAHEIPVGPVHAGIIEPGHFRFTIIGERILRLEERLGYVHRGALKHLQQADISTGTKIAGRICGDSTVAYAWSFCMAVEMCYQMEVPKKASWLRALLLERERVANHLGDLGALGNDAGFTISLAQFSRLKEKWMRTNAKLFGHRYLMDMIVPGGVAKDFSSDDLHCLIDEAKELQKEVDTLKLIFDEHTGLQERLQRTGKISPKLARTLGILGLPGRASDVSLDCRVDISSSPYDELKVNKLLTMEGDVADRVELRFAEITESLRLICNIVVSLPSGSSHVDLPSESKDNLGFGCVEGWRGPILIALSLEHGKFNWVHAHDPSWQNWPALEHAVIGNIVPDFPLINKSFNLAYSGHDL